MKHRALSAPMAILAFFAGIAAITSPAPAASNLGAAPNPSASPCALAQRAAAKFTPPPGDPGLSGIAVQDAIAQGEAEAQKRQKTRGGASPSPSPGASANPCPTPFQGELLARLFSAASSYIGHNTKFPGTNCPGHPNTYEWWGHCACAKSVSEIIKNATGYDFDYYSVDQYFAAAQSGKYGGGLVPDTDAVPGSIIMWYSNDHSEAHIGFCAVKGCSETLSNSSTQGVFAPEMHDISLDGYYPLHYIWNPTHIP